MKKIVLAALMALVAVQPAWARPPHRGHARHHLSRGNGPGMPITAQSDAIRINSVGEVISKPTAVIQKERNFDSRVRNELAKQPPAIPKPAAGGDPLSLRP